MKSPIYYESKSDKLTYPILHKRRIRYEMPMHFHENIELMYILSGDYETEIDNTKIVATADDIVFVPNFYIHSGKQNNDLEVFFYQPRLSNTISFHDLFKKRTLPFLMQDKAFNRETILPLLEYFYARPSQIANETVMQGAF
ncbi:MAG: cupin domain-containing protein [Clostridia bacterium]|nr:cupin domain-containing protein [Clostridia bacterium]